MSFSVRIQRAKQAEMNVITALRADNWIVFEFGQGLLPTEFRDVLREQKDNFGRPSLVRWFPDLIAFKRQEAWRIVRRRAVLIDVKSDDPKRDRWAIEIKALEACESFQNHFFTACWFVFDDGKLSTMTPEMVRCHATTAGYYGFGTGTPFVVVDKTCAKNINQILTETA